MGTIVLYNRGLIMCDRTVVRVTEIVWFYKKKAFLLVNPSPYPSFMDALAPPSYRRYSTRPGLVPVTNDLPPYTPSQSLAQPVQVVRREPTEHVFKTNDGKIVLKVDSGAKSPRALPTFVEKEAITGKLEVAAGKGDSIQAIVIVVRGKYRLVFNSMLNNLVV